MERKLRHVVERHPLLWAAALAAAAVVAVDGYVLCGGIAALVILLTLLKYSSGRVVLIALFSAFIAGRFHGRQVGSQQRQIRGVQQAPMFSETVEGRIVGEPKTGGRGWSALVDLQDDEYSGKVWWRGEGLAPGRGEVILGRGSFEPFPQKRNPGEFDFAGWLYRQGAWGIFTSRGEVRSVKAPPFLDRWATKARIWFRHSVTRGMEPESRNAAVIRAMVLGENPDDDDALIDMYRSSGTLHVFSVSGMHVAMVGLVVWLVLKSMGVSRRPAVVVILLAMLCYAWITGMRPPATRAVTMAGVILSAFFVRRRPDLLNALGLALLITVVMNGHLIFRAGVQLSFGVVFAIGIGTEALSRLYSVIQKREPYLPLALYGPWRAGWLSIRKKVVQALSGSSAASLGSLPLTLWHFGFVAPISIIASPLMGVPVFILMSLALLSAGLCWIPGASEGVNRVNAEVAGICSGIASMFARVPGGNFAVGFDRPGEDFLIVYDIGYGGGAACLHDGGSTVLLDTASRPGFRRTVLPSLRRMALTPESVVLSHPESGHLGGAIEALDSLPIRQILLPVERGLSSSFRDFLRESEERGIAMGVGQSGRSYRISPEAWFEVLCSSEPEDWRAVADERVMVIRLHWHGWRVLFVNDAGWATERALLDRGIDVGADVIVAGRHSYDGSLGDRFLEAVDPQVIIVSHSDYPVEERVPEGWLKAQERAGIKIFNQGETGAVSVVPTDEGSLKLRGFIDESELELFPEP